MVVNHAGDLKAWRGEIREEERRPISKGKVVNTPGTACG